MVAVRVGGRLCSWPEGGCSGRCLRLGGRVREFVYSHSGEKGEEVLGWVVFCPEKVGVVLASLGGGTKGLARSSLLVVRHGGGRNCFEGNEEGGNDGKEQAEMAHATAVVGWVVWVHCLAVPPPRGSPLRDSVVGLVCLPF